MIGHQDVGTNTNDLVIKKYEKRSLWGEAFHRLRKNKGAIAGFAIFAVIILCFLYGLFFINYDMATKNLPLDRLLKPSLQYPFGTDNLGRNLFYRVLYGARYSLAIGFGGSIIAASIGITLGSIAGYYGGIRESLVMRFTEILLSVPGLLLGMVIMSALGSSLGNLILCVGVTSIPVYIRMSRASILSVKNLEYVEAAHAIGFSTPRIIFSEILPNAMSPLIVSFSMNIGLMVMTSAGLSFLGFGITPPQPEWGTLIAGSRQYMRTSSYLLTAPGVFIMATVLAFNMIGDGLRDALDPKLKR